MFFEDIILSLQKFWQKQGCALLQPIDIEVGAATFHPEIFFKALDKSHTNIAFPQASRRPGDGRYGKNPNRFQKFHQFQVIMKPSPDNIQELTIESFKSLGINCEINEIQFIEDNWESPTLGASGVGWEVCLNGMEILQYTYFQQVAGITCNPVTIELAYGLERIAMHLQGKENMMGIDWNKNIQYKDLFLQQEIQQSYYNFEYADTEFMIKTFNFHIKESTHLAIKNLYIPAYEHCIKASHLFNTIEARGGISPTERSQYISKVKNASIQCAKSYCALQQNNELSNRNADNGTKNNKQESK